MLRAFVVLLAVALLAAGCGEDRVELPVITQVPSFALTDQHGQAVSRDTMRGKVWVANFIFTSCPDVCPLLTKKMSDLRLGLSRKETGVHFVSFSIDPETDTPAVLLAYAKKRGADFPDWAFVTGPIEAIEEVVVGGFKQAVKADPDKPDNILHGSHFVLVDQAGSIRGFYRSDADGLLALSKAAAQLATEGTH